MAKRTVKAIDITENGDITMTRGDSGCIVVKTFAPGDTVVMTVRKRYKDEIIYLQKTITEFTDEGEAVIAINHDDTDGMTFGTYVYDIQVTFSDGQVITPLKATFTVTEEATWS